MTRINIVFSTDDNYFSPTLTAAVSVLKANPDCEFDFYILTERLSEEKIGVLESKIKGLSPRSSLFVKTIDRSMLEGFPIRSNDHVSIAAYFRIFLPHLMPENIEKLLYLDGDILCVDSLKAFYDTNLEGFSCHVIRDERNNDEENFKRLGYLKENGYFNSGVMLINLAWWRENSVQEKTIKYIEENAEVCLWHDQDALNFILNGTVKFADFRYNFMQGFYFKKSDLKISEEYFAQIDEARKNPCIIHFSSAYKPWHTECNHPLKAEYREFYKEAFGRKLPIKNKLCGFARLAWILKRAINFLEIKKYADFREAER